MLQPDKNEVLARLRQEDRRVKSPQSVTESAMIETGKVADELAAGLSRTIGPDERGSAAQNTIDSTGFSALRTIRDWVTGLGSQRTGESNMVALDPLAQAEIQAKELKRLGSLNALSIASPQDVFRLSGAEIAARAAEQFAQYDRLVELNRSQAQSGNV